MQNSGHDIYDAWLDYAALQGLVPRTPQYRQEKKEFIAERVLAGFRAHFGDDVGSLEAWKAICRTTGVKDASQLTSITECRKALSTRHCNIIELVDAANAGRTVKTFKTREQLARYTKDTNQYFSKDAAKGVPLLEEFLVEVIRLARLEDYRTRRRIVM